MRHRSLALAAAASLAVATPAAAGPVEDFHALMDDYWATYLRNSPSTATAVGVPTYDAQLDALSLAEFDRQAAEAAAFLTRLEAIPAASLPPADQSNRAILKRTLEAQVAGNRFGQRQMLYSTLGSYHGFLGTMVDNQPFRTRADYANYLQRLARVPERMRAYGEISAKAAREGFVQPCVTMGGFAETVTTFVAADPAKSTFYAPFAAAKPESVSASDWAQMQARARELIAGPVNQSYRDFAQLYERDLKGKCRESVGVSALPQGQEYYRWLVGQFTTTDLTPDQIHALGLKEVAKIRADMEAVARKAGFPSREAMIADMRANPKFYVKTPDELLEATALVTKTIDGKMPSLFTRLPRLPYGIRPMAAATAPGDTTARYQPGSPDAGVAGYYLVNTTKLDQRPLWEIPVLS
ncbi:MAG TPA: DUF885 domain-containing protein, partial [Sphingomicrobium sp.]|nr:DUF885 domain-containing protein [Sphingomicrobium sp.]